MTSVCRDVRSAEKPAAYDWTVRQHSQVLVHAVLAGNQRADQGVLSCKNRTVDVNTRRPNAA